MYFLHLVHAFTPHYIIMVSGLPSSSSSPPEESLEVLGQLCPPGIAGVHGDEEPHRRHQLDLHPLEQEALLPVPDGILDALHLHDNPKRQNGPVSRYR